MVPQNNVPALLLSAALIAGAASPAVAQSWPDRPLTMVVPFGAGSASDTVGRVLAAGLSEVLGQQVIIENIAGGGSMTGTSRVAKSAPDGYQFVFASVDSIAIVPTMHKAPLYNSATDFAAVGLVVEQPIVLITRKDLPPNTMQEFAAYAKANQDKMQFGSSGVGSGSHFACSRLNAALGVNPTHVPYRGSGQAMQDLIGGRIDYFCALGAAAMGPLEGGTAKAVALLTGERSSLFPNAADRQGARYARRRFLFLDRVLLSQGYARRHRAEAQRRHDADLELARHAGAAEESRRDRDRSGPAIARVSPEIRGNRSREMACDDQGERHHA